MDGSARIATFSSFFAWAAGWPGLDPDVPGPPGVLELPGLPHAERSIAAHNAREINLANRFILKFLLCFFGYAG
ncbi:MAG: hypothetical protein HFF29_11030 [Oscillospiraceae bacterium]|nr:hypothetical protein [Oscillospiraceae bacterium]